MNALEDAAFAPFMSWSSDLRRAGCLEDAAHEEALHLHGEEGLEDGGWVRGPETFCGEGGGGGGAENL